MKNASTLALLVIGFSLAVGAGCAGSEASEDKPAEVTSDLTAPTFPGRYAPASKDDEAFFESVEVVRSGAKFAIVLDGTTFDLARTSSGAQVFTTGDLDGDCDDPGCSFRTKVSGVVFFKKVGNAKKAMLKLTVREQHPHPEFDGDIDGETTTTVRWTKAR